MKRFLSILLALAMVLSMVPAMAHTAHAETTAEADIVPFYGMGWSDINRTKFSNLEGLATVSIHIDAEGALYLKFNGKTDIQEIATSVKTVLDAYPAGMRYMSLFGTSQALAVDDETDYVVYADKGIAQLKALFTAFLQAYADLGGKLDGVALDTEYVKMGGWYIYSKEYYGEKDSDGNKIEDDNPQIYNQIVADPRYETEIRPLLEERGFVFYEKVNTESGGLKSEIYSIYPNSYLASSERAKYTNCTAIWNNVMGLRIADYLNEAVYEPLAEKYPDAILSDYQEPDSYSWLKNMSDDGSKSWVGGNGTKVGNASNYNTYNSRPSSSFFYVKDSEGTITEYLYKNPVAYNEAVYEESGYNMFLWDINRFKNIYAATENKQMNAWIAEYDYNEREGSSSNTPYYTETILHLGMLDPKPFLVYIYRPEFDTEEEYNARMQVISEILTELTRVAGYGDREPIETPASWNDGFVLSGMYTGGRNLWRISPDTTGGMTLENFKVADQAPTFSANGVTITFPQGRIIADGEVSVVGTCGYWVETPKDVEPVITYAEDRYANNPSYVEDFDYDDGTVFSGDTADEKQAWEVTGDVLVQNGELALSGTATVNNVKLPANITAGDTYAKQQTWEVAFTLSEAMTDGTATLLNGAFKLEGNKAYYKAKAEYTELADLTAGTKYTVKVDNNFAANTATYTISADGAVVAAAEDVVVAAVTLPVETIGFAATDLATTVLVDDYKLYPNGLAQDLEIYNAATGIQITADSATDKKIAYRVSWLNATETGKKANVVANIGGTETVVATVEMTANADGVATGIIDNPTGAEVTVSLTDAGTFVPEAAPEGGDFTWEASVPTVAPTEATEPETEPTEPETEATEPSVEPDPEMDPVPIPEYGSALAEAVTVKMSFSSYKLTNYDKPIYLVNNSAETQDTAGNVFTKWVPTTSGATEDNYNAKLIWNSGDAAPTLILRGFKYDVYNNEYEKLESKTDSTGAYTGSSTQIYPLTLPSNVPMNIVLTGEDSLIESQFGITYANNTTITSEGDTKLEINSRTACIGSATNAGAKLTINANLDLSTASYYNGAYSAGVIQSLDADLTINGGTIVCDNTAGKSVAGIVARNSGNVIINGGNITAHGEQGQSSTSGSITAPGGKVIINHGAVNVTSMEALAIYALEAIEINGGNVNINSPYYGMNTGNDDAPGQISINAGVVEIVSVKGGFYRVPVVAEDIEGYAGVDAENTDIYNETKYRNQYIKLVGHTHTVVDIAAVAHTCDTVGWTAGTKCSDCGMTLVAREAIAPYGHTEEVIPAVETSCSAPGLAEGVKCSTCGDILVAQEEIAALPHTEEVVPGRAATCAQTGLTDGVKCSVCGKFLVLRETIEKLAHTEEVIPAVEATDTESGLTEGKKCSVCGEILVAQEAIAPLTAQMEWVRVMGYVDLKAWTDGRSTYMKNEPVECYYTVTNEDGTTETVTFQGTKWTTIASETLNEPEEWNVKFEWPAGGVPTLVLKGAVLDYLDDATGKFSAHQSGTWNMAVAGKESGEVLDLKIVIAEDSYIATPNAVVGQSAHYGDIIVTSIGDAKLTTRSTGGIISNQDLILDNANLDMEVYYFAAGNRPIYAPKGGITFNGGNYKLVSDVENADKDGNGSFSAGEGRVGALIYAAAGDIVFNGGTYDLTTGYYSTTGGAGAVMNASAAADGYTVIVNDGNFNINHSNITALWSNNVMQINGGYIYASGNHYALDKSCFVKMAGGTLEFYRTTNNNSFYSVSCIDLSEYPCWTGVMGSDADNTTAFTELTTNRRYIKVSPHALTEVAEVPATCDAEGTIQHWHCEKCGKNFADALATEEIADVAILGGHIVVTDEAVAPGCTTTGLTEGSHCDRCGEVYVAQEEIAALGHTEEIVPGYAKTCSTDGLTDGKVCTVCGDTTLAQVVITAGHDVEIIPRVEPTDTQNGLTDGVKCSTCGKILVAQESIPATAVLTEMIRVDGYDDIKASTDGKCSYLVNEPVECYYTVTNEDGTTEMVTFMGTQWKVVGNWTKTEPAEWNVKYSFPEGGVPTLTLKGAILDYYDEVNGRYATATADFETFADARHLAISGKSFENDNKYDLHIVIEEDSSITTKGVTVGASDYFLNTIISSVGDAKLTVHTNKGICSNSDLILNNANLEIEVPHYVGTGYNPIYVKGDVVFNGGNYKVSSSATGTTSGTGATGRLIQSTAGSIIINDGNFDLDTSYYSSSGIPALDAKDTIIINGGNVDLCHGLAHGFNAPNGIIMNGGSLNVSGSYNYTFGKTNGQLTMNGGSLELYREGGSAYYDATNIDLSGNPCWYGVFGTSPTSNEEFTELTATNRYIKITTHKIVELPGSEASCGVAGLTAGQYCELCEKVLVAQEEIPALEHEWIAVPGKDATCSEPGLTEGEKCANCGEISVEQEETEMLEHEWVEIPGKDATCSESGLTEGEACAVCGEISVEQEEIEMLEHESISVEGKDPTCTESGLTEGEECAVCGEVLSGCETIPALGHTEEAVAGKAATCTEPGLTDGVICIECGETVTAQEEIPATGHIDTTTTETTTPATCTAAGSKTTTVTCACGEVVSETVEEIAALGHTEEVIPGKEATETETGLTEGVKCSVCGDILVAQEEIPATGPAAPTNPVATLDGTKVVWDLGDGAYTLSRVYVFYVDGQEIEDIQVWKNLVNAAAAVENSPYRLPYWKDDTGMNTVTGDAMYAIDLPKNGDYVLRFTYTDTATGSSATISQAINVDVERVPEVTLEGTKLVVNENYGTTPLTEMYVFWFGDMYLEDIEWASLAENAATLTDSPYAKTKGFKKLTGEAMYNFLISKSGEHVLRLVYTDAEGNEQKLSQRLTVPFVPTATVDETDVIIDDNGGITPVEKVFVYYVGETVINDLNDYKELQAAGALYPEINKSGYYTEYNGEEVNQISVPVKGNYVLRIQYQDTEDGNATKVVTQQLRVDFVVSIVNGTIRFDEMDDVTLSKVHLFYLGDNEVSDVQSWSELVAVGKLNTTINGKNGVKSYSTTSSTTLRQIKPSVNGRYVVRVEYYVDGVVSDSGTQILHTLSKQFTLEMGPVIDVVDGKFTVDTRDLYTIDQITVFYVGDKTVSNPTWGNCVNAAANIEGSPYGETGYVALKGMDAINAAEITTSGNYILRVNFVRDGESFMMIAEITV